MNIYFSGIGGVGIGPLAEIAFDAGYSVQGSDAKESSVTDELQARGIVVSIGQDGSFLQAVHNETPIDWFVYTAALPENHPELVLAQQLGIKTTKRDELLAQIIKEKDLKLIAIAGTHGKTTTTGMLVWTLQKFGIPVSYSVGTTLSFGPSGKFDPSSHYFVYECDEFDANFLHFHPYLSLIPSIDYDHPDSFSTQEDYLAAFKQFGQQSQQIIAWKFEHGDLFFDHPDTWLLDQPLDIHLQGEHNRYNATLVAKAIEKLGIHGDVLAALQSFPGTSRRFEKLADNLYSDYGHHPVEIAVTLQMAHELSDHVVLVYQPHQNVRQLKMKAMYTHQFEKAEEIYWLPTYLSREDPDLAIFSPEELTQRIINKEVVHIADLNDELWDAIQKARDDGKLVLCMGAGSIDAWIRTRLTGSA
jgi:UDP-N-acetylmuramate--alanine ligase